MAGPRSPNETSSDCLVSSFHRGWLRQISKQLTGIREVLTEVRATQDRDLVLTGQILEAVRSMGQPTAPPPPSGHPSLWQAMKEYAQHFVLLSKVWHALRSGPWGMLLWLGYGALKWLGVF